jgi:plasmid stabilization system protein ParE
MVKTLEQAIAEVATLPAADQEQIGRKLLSHVEKLHELRGDIDKGVASLDAGQGQELNIEKFIQQKKRGMAAAKPPILWSPEALADLDQIWEYYAGAAGPAVADNILRAIDKVVSVISDYPCQAEPVMMFAPGCARLQLRHMLSSIAYENSQK